MKFLPKLLVLAMMLVNCKRNEASRTSAAAPAGPVIPVQLEWDGSPVDGNSSINVTPSPVIEEGKDYALTFVDSRKNGSEGKYYTINIYLAVNDAVLDPTENYPDEMQATDESQSDKTIYYGRDGFSIDYLTKLLPGEKKTLFLHNLPRQLRGSELGFGVYGQTIYQPGGDFDSSVIDPTVLPQVTIDLNKYAGTATDENGNPSLVGARLRTTIQVAQSKLGFSDYDADEKTGKCINNLGASYSDGGAIVDKDISDISLSGSIHSHDPTCYENFIIDTIKPGPSDTKETLKLDLSKIGGSGIFTTYVYAEALSSSTSPVVPDGDTAEVGAIGIGESKDIAFQTGGTANKSFLMSMSTTMPDTKLSTNIDVDVHVPMKIAAATGKVEKPINPMYGSPLTFEVFVSADGSPEQSLGTRSEIKFASDVPAKFVFRISSGNFIPGSAVVVSGSVQGSVATIRNLAPGYDTGMPKNGARLETFHNSKNYFVDMNQPDLKTGAVVSHLTKQDPTALVGKDAFPALQILHFMEEHRNAWMDVIEKGKAFTPRNTLTQSTASGCLENNAAEHWSDLTLHFYCQIGMARLCYTGGIQERAGKIQQDLAAGTINRDEAGKRAMGLRASVFASCAQKAQEAYNDAATKGNLAEFLASDSGESEWVWLLGENFVKSYQAGDENELTKLSEGAKIFRFVMEAPTFAFDYETQQRILNLYYRVSQTYGEDFASITVDKCKGLRPRRAIDSTSENICLPTKAMAKANSAAGR